jgi:glycosyltransferase involved in cell wall biosynthesis
MVADYLGTGHPPRIVLPNGITPPTLTPLPTLVGKTVFLYCGRISEQKNLDLLLDAWAIADLANCAQLFLAGHDDSPYAKRILSRASTLPGLRLLGRISGKDKADAFAASHFGVLSSQAEGLSISLLESLACGRPAIATTACHMPDITGRNLGWIADDPHTYAAALREACNLDSRRRLEMSNNCRDYICAYHHWPTLGNRMGHLYMDLCAGKRISDLQSFCPVNQP